MSVHAQGLQVMLVVKATSLLVPAVRQGSLHIKVQGTGVADEAVCLAGYDVASAGMLHVACPEAPACMHT